MRILALVVLFSALAASQTYIPVAPTLPATCMDGQVFFATETPVGWSRCRNGAWERAMDSARIVDLFNAGTCSGYLKSNGTCDTPSAGGGVPTGMITLILSGSCPAGWTEASALNGKMLRGTLAANGDVGQLGGNATITPAGTINAQTFTGSQVTTSAVSAGIPAGTNSTAIFTPLGTIAWPASVPIFTGAAFSSVINHTHTVSITDPGHTHTLIATTYVPQLQGGTTAATTGTHIMTSTATGGSLRSSAETTVSKAATENSQVTGISASTANPSGGVASITPAGTIAWPTSVPTLTGTQSTVPAETFTGSALATHTHTATAAGAVSQASFTGNPIDPSPSYTKVIFCSKN